MYYFLLKTNKRNPVPYSINKNRAIDIRYINKENSYKIPNCSVVEMKLPSEAFLPDILSEPMFMVDERFAEVIEMYVPETIFKTVYLLHSESGIHKTYFLPILEDVECLSDETKRSYGETELLQIVLRKEAVVGKSIFRVAGFHHSYVIGRLDLVESILRRGIRGIELMQVEVV